MRRERDMHIPNADNINAKASAGRRPQKAISDRESRDAERKRAQDNPVSRNFDSYGFETSAFGPVTPAIGEEDARYDSYGFDDDKKSRYGAVPIRDAASQSPKESEEGEDASPKRSRRTRSTKAGRAAAAKAAERLSANAADDNGDDAPRSIDDVVASMNERKARNSKLGWIGTMLVAVGVTLIIAAIVFILASTLYAKSGVLAWEKVSSYEVPDGLLQGQDIGDDTSVTYLYDVPDDGSAYAVEYHAVARYEGALAGDEDLYVTYVEDASDGEDAPIFQDMLQGKPNVKKSGVTNYRRIDIHLPIAAKKGISK